LTMKALQSERGITSLQVGVAILVAFLIFFAVGFFMNRESSNRLRTELEESAKKTQLLQTMKNELLASAEAEKSSVMADTDEASKEFAGQSEQASQKVERARIDLQTLVKGGNEAKLLDDFSSCWVRLQGIDKEILSLAVQNTNIKAARLSFGPAAAAIRNMENALDQLMDAAASYHDLAGITRFAYMALAGALNLYTLQAPHIAESTDAGMDRLEADMKKWDEQVQDALNRLDGLAGDSIKPMLSGARKSYQDFWNLNTEIIALSRRNSNVRSFEMSLVQKRGTLAKCLESLDALQKAVQENVTFKATR
jgi:hypothetical protein